MVCIDQVPWNEIRDEELVCQVEDPFFMHIELELRRKIYMWKHFPVDMVFEPCITIPKIVGNTGYGLGEDSKIIALNEGTTAPSRKYNRVLKDYETWKSHCTRKQAIMFSGRQRKYLTALPR